MVGCEHTDFMFFFNITNMAIGRNFEVVPDRFQISEIYAAKKLRTKRENCVASYAGFRAQLEAFTEIIPKLFAKV